MTDHPPSPAADASSDIRLLGRLIGDVLRDQAGDDTFDLVERVRRTAVGARREGTAPIAELTAQLHEASLDDQLHLIRAFGWLSLLANTAEDVHTERRRRFHRDAGRPAQEGSLEAGLDKLLAIAAHPTEVRRKTILTVVEHVAHLLEQRARVLDSPSELAQIDAELRLDVLTLWQTAKIRLSKLRVRDEINEALRYYEASIFDTVPALQRDLAALASSRLDHQLANPAPIRMGSWIGGDRDGNPFVTAPVLKLAVEAQATEAFTRRA